MEDIGYPEETDFVERRYRLRDVMTVVCNPIKDDGCTDPGETGDA
jgi:hypothetical protein